jgi:N-acetyl-S-(2-succino)cysteine monooxygenase
MSLANKQLRLGAFLMSSGHHVAAWRHSNARASGGLDEFVELVIP